MAKNGANRRVRRLEPIHSIKELLLAGCKWQPIYCNRDLLKQRERNLGAQRWALESLPSRHWRNEFSSSSIVTYFNLHRKDSAFCAAPIDWGIGLTEPQITRALAHFLSNGPKQTRSLRIRAFLQALGLKDLEDELPLSVEVSAEEQKIDLKIAWNKRVIIVEAKLGHKITEGQLRKYYKNTQWRYKGSKINCFVLALGDHSARGIHYKQKGMWPLVKWMDVWIKFERVRPVDNDPQLQKFLRTLWDRINRLQGVKL